MKSSWEKKNKPKDNTFPDPKLWVYNKHNSMIPAYKYNYFLILSFLIIYPIKDNN